MNDRLKYRVWDKENEIWLENGDCSLSMDGELTVLGIDAYGETMFCDNKNYLIEQSTGLKDKNGKLIYEGDWLKTKDDCYCYVVWYDGFWWVKSLPSEAMDLEHSEFYKECEVVGNINNNPNFMENEE